MLKEVVVVGGGGGGGVGSVSSPFVKLCEPKKRRLLVDAKNCLLDSDESVNDASGESSLRITRSKIKTALVGRASKTTNASSPLKISNDDYNDEIETKMTRSKSKLLQPTTSSFDASKNEIKSSTSKTNTKQERKTPYIEIDIDGEGLMDKQSAMRINKTIQSESDSDSDCIVVLNQADPGRKR